MRICQIPAEATRQIRQHVLWPSIPIESQLLPFDSLPTTRHYGAYIASPDAAAVEELVACLTITLENYKHPDRLPKPIQQSLAECSAPQYQLHKFAVLPAHQGQGIGKALLQSTLKSLISQTRHDGGRILLFHFDARTTQLDLYQHLGFQVLDEERFMKYGATGTGPGVEYVRMGRIVNCTR